MRVTMLVRCLAMMRGGGETRHLAWIRELEALGVEVDVIAGRPFLFGGPRHPVDRTASTVVRSPYVREAVYRWQNVRGFGRLTKAALHADEEWFCRAAWRLIAGRSVPPDIVHAHALHQAARLRRGPAAVVINLPGAPAARYVTDLQLADAIVADGWAATHLPQTIGRPIRRVTKGVDTILFTPDGANCRRRLNIDDRRVVLAVGRLVPLKNFRLLLDAVGIARRSEPRLHLVLVGEGPERRTLEQHASAIGIADCVSFVGYVDQTDTALYYRSADVFALTSHFDNSPNVVLEAMACGLPVVSTDVGGVGEFLDPAGGELVPAGDADRFAAALVRVLASPERSRTIGRRNRELTLDRFSWRRSAQQLLEVYSDVLARRTPAVRVSA